jgi:hypothetical protein
MTALQTDTNLQESIVNCIDRAMSNREITAHGPFKKALTSQSLIGWLALLRGYWSKEWQRAYAKTYPVPTEETKKQRNKERNTTMTRWQKKIIQTIWGQMIQLWTLRNAERHGWDKESRDRSRREVLHKELEDLYNRKTNIPNESKNYYGHHTRYTSQKLSPRSPIG